MLQYMIFNVAVYIFSLFAVDIFFATATNFFDVVVDVF